MTRVTITKLERDPRGFWTAHISDGTTTVKVDNRIGPWTTPRNPYADHGSNQVVRGEVIPEVAARLRAKARAAERGERHDDDNVEIVIERGGGTRNLPKPPAPKPEPEPAPDDRSRAARFAQRMADAGAAAIRKVA